MFIKKIKNLLCASLMSITLNVYADSYPTVVESDTDVLIEQINTKAKKDNIAQKNIGGVMQWSARQLVGEPYVRSLLDQKEPEYLYISLTNTDCMLFVEEILSLGILIKHNDLTLTNYTNQIKDVRYHGNISFCNRNHYFKDWALENIKKGLVVDAAYPLSKQYLPYKADVMSASLERRQKHLDDLECIKEREEYVNNEKLGFIPLKDVPKNLKNIKSGDIIGIVRTPNNKADSIHHLGIANITKDGVGMIHASSEKNKVIVEKTLMGYLNRFDDMQGIILLRAK